MATRSRAVRPRANSDTRARILDTARALVARHGYAGTSITMICRTAGINASSLYWFFASKEELFLAVIEEGARAFLDAVSTPREGKEQDDAVASVSRQLSEHALFLRVLLVMMLEARELSPAFRARVHELRARSLDWWRALLTPLCQPADLDEFAVLCRATVNGAFIAEQFGEPVSVEDVLRRLLGLLDGARADRP